MSGLFPSPSPGRSPRREETDASDGSARHPLTVSQTAELLRVVLAGGIPGRIAIVGEVSNFSNRQHWFFSLKDAGATLRCVCFASNARRCRVAMEDGLQVIATGRLDFYDQQGQLQLYVESVEPVGRGSLEQQLKALIEQLRQEGYLAPERKRPLPTMPCRVAVVTSRSGAALQDVINTAGRRWAGCELLLVDVMVQGAGAAPGIARALQYLSHHGRRLNLDAIILTRGGGSIEDLWAFNERSVADAIFRSTLPIVAAIGHETDVTVAELVADVRCATPTQAAMTLIPDRGALEHQVQQAGRRLEMVMRRHVEQAKSRLSATARSPVLRRPALLLTPATERLARAEARLGPALQRRLLSERDRLHRCERQLVPAVQRRFERAAQKLGAIGRQLEAVGPKSVLRRGYTWTLGGDGRIVRRPADVAAGEKLTTVTAEGDIRSTVDGTKPRRSPKQQSPPPPGGLFSA